MTCSIDWGNPRIMDITMPYQRILCNTIIGVDLDKVMDRCSCLNKENKY